MAYFPMFVELDGKHCLIIGGGKVAYRKVEVLADFGAELLVIAPEICEEIKNFAAGNIAYEERVYMPQDIGNCFLVVAATDDEERNHEIAQICRQKKILVNAVEQIGDCDFIFPSYVKEPWLVHFPVAATVRSLHSI